MFNEKLQVDFLFLGDTLSLHVMDVFSKYAPLLRVRSEDSRAAWDAFRKGRLEARNADGFALAAEN